MTRSPRTIFAKDLLDNRKGTIWWVLGMAALGVWITAMFPVIRDSEEMQELLNDIPPEALAIFGIDVDSFLTGAGYLQGQLYSFNAPIIVLAFAIVAGIAATAREEQRGTMDMLLATPVSRSSVVIQKGASLALRLGLITSALSVVIFLLNVPLDLGVTAVNGIAATIALWMFGLVFAAIAMTLGAWTGSPGVAGGVTAFLAVVSWLVRAFAPLFDWLEIPSRFSPFRWYTDMGAMLDGFGSELIWLTVAVIAFGAIAAILFRRRDIGTERSLFPTLSFGRTRTKAAAVEPRRSSLLRSVYGKALWDRRTSVWVWGLSLGAILFITFSAWPAIAGDAEAMQAIMDSIPAELLALFGLTDPQALATPAGFVSSRTYGSVGPIVLIVFTITAMTAGLAREESTGRLDMVLSNPVPRDRIVPEKSAALGVLVAIIALTLTVIGLVGNELFDTQLGTVEIVAANVGLALLGLCFWGIAAALWAYLGAGAAIGITSALGVATWFINGLGSIVDLLGPLRWMSPFYWYLGDVVPLAKGITLGYVALGVVAAVGSMLAGRRLRTRDLAV